MTRLGIAGLAGIALMASAAADAQTIVEKFTTTGTTVATAWEVPSSDPCIQTLNNVVASDGLVRQTGSKTPNVSVFVLFRTANNCTQRWEVYGIGGRELTAGELVIDNWFQWVTLTAKNIDLYDHVCRCTTTIDINMRWTATSPFETGFFISRSTFGGGSYLFEHRGQARLASVAGTVSDGITNFTPSIIYGTIEKSTVGEMTITRATP